MSSYFKLQAGAWLLIWGKGPLEPDYWDYGRAERLQRQAWEELGEEKTWFLDYYERNPPYNPTAPVWNKSPSASPTHSHLQPASKKRSVE